MTKWGIAAALAAVMLASCQAPGVQAKSSGCIGFAHSLWQPKAGEQLSVDASAEGPTCELAVATLAVRKADGSVLLAEAFPAANVMVLKEQKTPAALDAALLQWVDQSKATLKTTADLPVWAPKAENPMAGEFAFYPETGMSRADYEAIRAHKAPLLCYVQGGESMACQMLKDGTFTKVGVQTFPG